MRNRDEVFLLTADEVTRRLPDDPRSVVAERRATWEHYRTLDLPAARQGVPDPVEIAGRAAPADCTTLTGTAASPDVAQGRVRVLSDPSLDAWRTATSSSPGPPIPAGPR